METENEVPSSTILTTTVALNTKATENGNKKIPNTCSFITTSEFNRLTKISFKNENERSRKESCK